MADDHLRHLDGFGGLHPLLIRLAGECLDRLLLTVSGKPHAAVRSSKAVSSAAPAALSPTDKRHGWARTSCILFNRRLILFGVPGELGEALNLVLDPSTDRSGAQALGYFLRNGGPCRASDTLLQAHNSCQVILTTLHE